MKDRPIAAVEIRLADAATTFVQRAIDLLCAVEEEPALVSDEIREKATELRELIQAGRW